MNQHVFPGADEKTPSRSMYFTWINNTNEGASAEQTRINLEFFRFLRDEFGMLLDIYLFDAGALDGALHYGSFDSVRFRRNFPEGFGPLAGIAAELGVRFGVWGGPGGFGETPESAARRTGELVSLCRDHRFALFKFDAVCGSLSPEYEAYFIETMRRCREYVPDLILLNHRLPLSEAGLAHATTFLWDGRETYIDVWSANAVTAPHHRAEALSRGVVPGLKRLAEDHGVCLSSCLDNWDDELVLQAFGRSLVVAPEIYGNPWLLRDDEFPKLARLFRLHREFRDILTGAKLLDEAKYGPFPVSRGDGGHRFVTLRNLSWESVERTVELADLGLDCAGPVEVRRFHPAERRYGLFAPDGRVTVTVPPFRALLLYAGVPLENQPCLPEGDFEVVRHRPGEAAVLRSVPPAPEVVKLAGLVPVPLPETAAALYEAAVFAADNNALECRSLARSGETRIPEVRAARDAFFSQPVFRDRMCCDRNLFNSDPELGFGVSPLMLDRCPPGKGCFRLDLGEIRRVGAFVLETASRFELLPLLEEQGYRCFVSTDLVNWRETVFIARRKIEIPVDGAVRYLKMPEFPLRSIELSGTDGEGLPLDRSLWRVNVLFPAAMPDFRRCYAARFRLPAIDGMRKLCLAVNGIHGVEGVYAAVETTGGVPGGFPDRAPSYPCNRWEYYVAQRDRNHTFYLPVDAAASGRELTVTLLCRNDSALRPDVYLA